MTIDRRSLIAASALAGATGLAAAAHAATPLPGFAIDAATFGLRPGSPEDQSGALQRAIDQAARAGASLTLPPGDYRVGDIKLTAGAQLFGARGATRLIFSGGTSLINAAGAGHITLSGLVLDGAKRPLADRVGLVQLDNCGSARIVDCEISGAGGTALLCNAISGEISGTTIIDTTDVALLSYDARGLLIARNTIVGAGNNGIQVWRRQSGDDGTLVVDNRIENIDNRSGGSGQYGNAINVFRAANVIVRGNRIRNCSFSAVRGNAASNIQIEGNSITDVREVAIYAEFGFEGALIANNVIDGAAIGVSVTNFNEGGRLAVVQGNIVRNLLPKRPAGTDPGDGAGCGIYVEADAAVTGNVVENAPDAGIGLGYGRYLRDVTVSGNVVRKANFGVTVSVAPGAGTALIANNVIAEARRGAIVGMDRRKVVTGDLMKGGGEQYAQLAISGNHVR